MTTKLSYTDLCRINATLRNLANECDVRLVAIENADQPSPQAQADALAVDGADLSFADFAAQVQPATAPAGTYVPAPCEWSHPYYLPRHPARGFRTLARAQAYARTLAGRTHEIRSCGLYKGDQRYSGAGKDSPFYA
jgi:hypothetical protein